MTDDRAELLAAALEAVPMLALGVEGDAITQAAPERAVLGYETGELVGSRWREYVHPDDRARAGRLAATAGEPAADTLRLLHADGSWRPFRCDVSALGGDRVAVVVREARADEHAVAELEDLRAALRTAAHDLKNILLAVGGYARLIRDQVEGQERDDLDQIDSAARRGAELVRDLLARCARQGGVS